ncbi:PREDICTED: dynein assembly factor 3, axonemal-like isoform X2 [Amphimedon queenslandica]|uniref:Dynein assembly factor 3, axonemal n=1 Tax=Amphimedon queenslandica TaxID=400682 RepID=A0A1X7UII0_AMPQE|nr:PREDICTED: dynein assembly factor 3, axonemal-like isoform X2 [Amphimedon queenslandica]|eukprot:XP_011404946.2 PREDICTED: dynein assembly factor 3, axonemal-like isoform X2 [Amphimedon queenslandica]
MAEGFGSVTWWGLTPALDLISLFPHGKINLDCDSTVNVLLVGAGDIRHVLRTVTNNPKKSLHFYVIESHLEVLARHILFFSLLCEPSDKIGIREKTELFLELFGNTLVRAQTAQYLKEKADDLIRFVTDPSNKLIPFLDLSSLKFKERDMLEGIFKFWQNPDEKTFTIEKHWDKRLRHHLAQRYDSRRGVFDWDYHMKLQEMVPLICNDEYIQWREDGVAFHLRDDAPYDISNRMLANGALLHNRDGDLVGQRGYWGDIVTSPFIAFGSYCDDERMLKKANDKYVKSSQEISQHNVYSMLELLLTGTSSSSSNPDSGIEEITNDTIGRLIDGSVRVTLLPLNSATELGKKSKYEKLFHCAFFSNSMIHHLTSVNGLDRVMNERCLLICETARFILDLRKENKDEYLKKVIQMALAIGFKSSQVETDASNTLLFTLS